MIATASFGMPSRPATVSRRAVFALNLPDSPTPNLRESSIRTGSTGAKVVPFTGGGGVVPIVNVRVDEVEIVFPAASSAFTRQQYEPLA